jgi:hypothetical protein
MHKLGDHLHPDVIRWTLIEGGLLEPECLVSAGFRGPYSAPVLRLDEAGRREAARAVKIPGDANAPFDTRVNEPWYDAVNLPTRAVEAQP